MNLKGALSIVYFVVVGGVCLVVLCGGLSICRGTWLDKANAKLAELMFDSLWWYHFEKWGMPWIYPGIVVILSLWNGSVLRKASTMALIEQANLVLCSVSLFIWLRLSDPGRISHANVKVLKRIYPHDGLIYQRGRICETCKLERLARSRHCRFCNICVARYDHHCGWIGNCVGGLNNVAFLAFLFLNIIMCARLGWLDYVIGRRLLADALSKRYILPKSSGESVASKLPLDVGPYVYFQYAMMFPSRDAYLLSGCFGILTIALAAFAGYHVRLIIINKTTIEIDRWEDLGDAIREHPDLAEEIGPLFNRYDRGWRANIAEVWSFRRRMRSALRRRLH